MAGRVGGGGSDEEGMTIRKGQSGADEPSGGSDAGVSLPVLGTKTGAVRASRMSRRRAISLAIVHLLIIGHMAHWLITGRSLSPVEPSEAMYTLERGQLNAGFVFFAASLAATLVLGRFVCGWGCHLIAYQDLCAWLMRSIGIKPKPFRSRLLVLAPFALAVYMFCWPTAYRLWVGAPAPELTNHLLKVDLWETMPGPVITVLTFFVCGFAIVYFLGAKGFCTYGCPYGGFFAVAEKVAVGRIRVTDACEHCGHCTATCTSNVRVHDEVRRFGMVVDPGCMKCMDCVSVCPNDALYFGFGRPSLGATAKVTGGPAVYDFTLWEEGLMAVVGVGALLTFRGLYGQIPLLMAMAMAGISVFVFAKLARMAGTANVRLQNLQLKRGGRVTGIGGVFASFGVLLLALTVHSAAVHYQAFTGLRSAEGLAIGDEVWLTGATWWASASEETRTQVERASARLEWADRWGLMPTSAVLGELVLLHVAQDELDEAEVVLRRLVDLSGERPEPYRGLASLMRKRERFDEAEGYYRRALGFDAGFARARRDLSAMLMALGRPDDALGLLREGATTLPDGWRWRLEVGQLLTNLGRWEDGMAELRPVVAQHSDKAEAQYAMGYTLLGRRMTEEALPYLAEACRLAPGVALYRYNLGVATFMAGRPVEALPHVREALRLDPDDPDAQGFLAVVLRELGDEPGAREP